MSLAQEPPPVAGHGGMMRSAFSMRAASTFKGRNDEQTPCDLRGRRRVRRAV